MSVDLMRAENTIHINTRKCLTVSKMGKEEEEGHEDSALNVPEGAACTAKHSWPCAVHGRFGRGIVPGG